MATSSRAIWKGAISFGLVHIPVSLHTATSTSGIDFDWLDKRSMEPVGYKRFNKATGKEIDKDDIVKGIAYESGKYVVLSDDEISAVYPRSTQTIDIEAFVSAAEIPFVYLDRPYYLAPVAKGEKVYALLREALLKTGRVGLARVVIQTKQHLAALVAVGPGLVLNLLRWGTDVRSWEDLRLPAEGAKANQLTDKELEMATQLVEDLTASFKPEDYRDSFKDQVMALVDKKVKAGDTEAVIQPDEEAPPKSADIIDLTELLQRSLRDGGAGKKKGAADKAPADAEPAAAKAKPPAPAEGKAPRKKRAA
ncbi:MAG: Ku protein [Pseudomonadota bacterium]|nr:Ku protein [Pseudomonadota bacterium]